MARRSILKTVIDFEGVLFGVSTTLKDFQFCWLLNRDLQFNLVKLEDLVFNLKKKGKTSRFSLFKYYDDINKWSIYVVSNKCHGEFLITEVKQPDYFIMIQGEVTNEQQKELLDKIKTVSAFQLVVVLDFHTLKSKQNLIFE